MAHRLLESPLPIEERKKGLFHFKIPPLEGRVGFSFYLGTKEYFLGLSINDVIKETVTRKRVVKIPKGKVHVFPFEE